MTLNNLDRAFLENFAGFASKNRAYSAVALMQALLNPTTTAVALKDWMNSLQSAQADQIQAEGEVDSDILVVKILYAKLIVEYAAACEDLAALCDAVARRKQGNKHPDQGIFTKFSASNDEIVKRLLVKVRDADQFDSASFLLLPAAKSLYDVISPDDVNDLQTAYDLVANNLKFISQTYVPVQPPTKTSSSNFQVEGLRPDCEVTLNVILGNPGDAQQIDRSSTHPFRIAANKIKHRFTVAENWSAFASCSDPTRPIPYAPITMDSSWIDTVFQNILTAAATAELIANVLLRLDDLNALG